MAQNQATVMNGTYFVCISIGINHFAGRRLSRQVHCLVVLRRKRLIQMLDDDWSLICNEVGCVFQLKRNEHTARSSKQVAH